MKKSIKIVLISLSAITVLVIVAMLIVVNIVLNPQKVTPIVNSALAEMVDGTSNVKEIDVSIFSSFPNLSITMDSIDFADSSDVSLLSVDELKISIDIVKYIVSRDVVISNIEFNKPDLKILTDTSGVSNIMMFKSLSTQIEGDTIAIDTTEFKLPDYVKSIEIKRVTLVDGEIYANDELLGSNISIKDISMSIAGKFDSKISDLTMDLTCDSINYTINNKHLLNSLKVGINTQFEYNRDSLLLTIEDANVDVGDISLNASGLLRGDKENMALITDLYFNLSTPSLENIIKSIPGRLIKKGQEFSADGSVELCGSIKGVYNNEKNEIPSFDLDFSIENGEFKFDNMEYGVERLDIAAELLIDGKCIENSILDVTKFIVSSDAGIDLNSKIKVTDILGSCNINFNVNCETDISRIKEILPIADGITLKGENTIHMIGMGRKDDILNKNFGALYLSGKSEFKDLLLIVDGSKLSDTTVNDTYLYVKMNSGNFNFGSEVKSIKEFENDQNLNADISFSGVGFKNKSGLEVFLSNVKLKAKSTLVTDTTQVRPISGELILDMFKANIQDTLSSHIISSKILFKTEPSKDDKSKATTTLIISADTIEAEAIPSRTKLKLNAADVSVCITPDTSSMRKYSMIGFTDFDGLQIFTPALPIDISMNRSRVSFDNNRIELSDSKIQMGQSNITVTGWMENFLGRSFGVNKNKIISDLSLTSDNIDFTELYYATILADSSLVPSAVEYSHTTNDIDTVVPMQIIMVPKYIESKLNIDLQKLTFGKHTIENVNGRIDIVDETIKLNNLELYSSNSKINVLALYNPVSTHLAHSMLSVKANRVVLEDVFEMIPSIDSLMPALRQIEGVVDFDMVAKVDIDSVMNFILPSLESVMSFTGDDLVLLDGETFKTVSKMLMFKNKKRNLIDSLSMNVIVRKGGYIDVPPFEILIDRYRAIIGGTQRVDFNNFDINYKYNVSIIKSPLPIKAGVDIKGKNDEFDFKITKAKLKRSDFSKIQMNIDSLLNQLESGI